jgi:hypothetical protein
VAEITVKRLRCCGFPRASKAIDKCINFGGGYAENYTFFTGSNITCFNVLYPFVAY